MTGAAEKRKYNRYSFKKPVQVYPVLPSKSGNIYEVQKQCLEVRSTDISEGGVRLESDNPFDPQYLLKMNFKVSKDRPVEVFGKIMWTQDRQFGVRFMLVDQEMRNGIRAIGKRKA